jgi:hypothetical protein
MASLRKVVREVARWPKWKRELQGVIKADRKAWGL